MPKAVLMMILLVVTISSCQSDKSKERTEANINKVLNAVNKVDGSGSVVKSLTDDIFFNEIIDTEESKATKILKLKNNNLPIVIDFYADWCGPCVKSKPYYENFAKQYQHRIIFYRVDVDKHNQAFMLLNRLVKGNGGIPFFIFINTKDQVDYLSGWNSDASPRLFNEKFTWLLE